MMHSKFSWFAVVAICIFNSVVSQGQVIGSNLTLHLKNGDVITGLTDITTIPFTTLYGNLAFPVADVNNISLGVSSKGVDRELLYEQLDKIQIGTVEEADRAFDKLVRMGANIIPLIRDYMQRPEYRPKQLVQNTVETLYNVMLELHNLPKNFSSSDLLVFKDDYTIIGNYSFESIAISTDFGDLNIKRSDIKNIEVQLNNEDIHSRSFKLFADQHIIANAKNGWLKTGMLVKAGDFLTIASNGEIQLMSLDGNTYTSDGGVNGSPGIEEIKPSFGNVVFKIGEGGPSIRAGDIFKGTIETTGILYLSIFESVFNSGNTGYYVAKVIIN